MSGPRGLNIKHCSVALKKSNCSGTFFIKGIKKTLRALLSYISKGEFVTTREKCKRHFSSVLKNSRAFILHNSTMHGKSFSSFYKIMNTLHRNVLDKKIVPLSIAEDQFLLK